MKKQRDQYREMQVAIDELSRNNNRLSCEVECLKNGHRYYLRLHPQRKIAGQTCSILAVKDCLLCHKQRTIVLDKKNCNFKTIVAFLDGE